MAPGSPGPAPCKGTSLHSLSSSGLLAAQALQNRKACSLLGKEKTIGEQLAAPREKREREEWREKKTLRCILFIFLAKLSPFNYTKYRNIGRKYGGKGSKPHPGDSISCIGVRFLIISLVNNLYDFIISTYHRPAHVVSYKLCMGIIFGLFVPAFY